MKIYISVDIEGITGVTSWSETKLGEEDHQAARFQMTREAVAACEAAVEMGAKEIYVKDAHDSARNMDISKFPKEAKIIRGWTGEPTSMLAGLDSTFDGLIFIGYHSASGREGNPLAHTINHNVLMNMKVDGEIASEFMLNSYVAAERGVAPIFVSGDKMLCEDVRAMAANIKTLAVKEGIGGATINMNPTTACELIKEGVKEALKDIEKCRLEPKKDMKVEMFYREHYMASKAMHYPGVKRTGAFTVEYMAETMEELMRTRMFIM